MLFIFIGCRIKTAGEIVKATEERINVELVLRQAESWAKHMQTNVDGQSSFLSEQVRVGLW